MTEQRALTHAQQVEQRLAWLEHKMVRVLWLLISVTAMGIGLLTYFVVGGKDGGWVAVAVGIVVWMFVGWVLQRSEFKGAPSRIRFIDP